MRRYLPSWLAGVIAVIVTLSMTVAQSARQSVGEPQMEMPIVASLFIEDGDFTSTLILVNGSAVSTYADVALRSPQGKTVATKRVQFQPHSQKQVSIRALLEAGIAPNITNGSVTVMQSPSLSSMVIVAALSITQQSSSTPHYIDQELAMPSASSSQMLRGVADSGAGSSLVAISSLSDMPQDVTITCLSDNGRETSKVSLLPEQTILTLGCGRKVTQYADFHWYAEHLPNEQHGPVAITLSSNGMPGSFAAFGLTPHESREGKYFSSIPFTDPLMLQSTTTIFAGVPIGSSPLLPRGNYMPVLTLANFSQAIRHVKVQYALTRNGASASVRTVDTLTLAPSTVQEVTLDGLEGETSLQDSFQVESDGGPGDVGVKLASKSDASLREVEFLGKDLGDPNNGGIHPWTVADGTISTLLLFNNTAKAQYFNVNISAGPVVWLKAYQLQPMQTQAISINDLIKRGSKDDKGHVLPSEIWRGEVAWHVPAKNSGRGRLLQSNPQADMARNFSCGYVAELCQVTYQGNTSTYSGGSMAAQMSTQVCMNNCSGTPAGPGGGGYQYNWWSSNTNIAYIPSADTSSQYVAIYGGDAGSTYINGSASDAYCTQYMPAQLVTVRPTITNIIPAQGLVGTAISVAINGTGFTADATVNAGPNISVSNVHFVSAGQITATFTPSNSTAAGGNQGITVAASSQLSNSSNFFVQYPQHLIYVNESGLTPNNGHSTTVSGTSVNIVTVGGNTIAAGVCGGYQWLTYTPTDQSGGSITTGTITFTESFSSFSPLPDPFPQPTPTSGTVTLPGGYLGDTQGLWGPNPPTCQPANKSDSFNQGFTATVGNVTYPITTVVTVGRSTNSQGVPAFNVSITTP